jgi:hypothetical protein
VNFVYAKAILLLASPGYAACIDIGTEPFAKNLLTVRLCIGTVCEVAVRTRSCGNIHYESEDYSATSTTWLFLRRDHNINDDADDEYFVLRNPIDVKSRPLGAVDGMNLWTLTEELPLEADKVQQMTCLPESGPETCGFVDAVLKNLRQP